MSLTVVAAAALSGGHQPSFLHQRGLVGVMVLGITSESAFSFSYPAFVSTFTFFLPKHLRSCCDAWGDTCGTLTGGLGRPERLVAIMVVQKRSWVLWRSRGRMDGWREKALYGWQQLNPSGLDSHDGAGTSGQRR